MWEGLQNLKEKILRSRLFERARSVEVTSKQKKEFEQKQPLSIDSKQKEHNLVAPQRQNSLVKMNELDQCKLERDAKNTGYEKQASKSGQFGNNINVSSQGSKSEEDENLLEGLQHSQQSDKIDTKLVGFPRGRQIFSNIDDDITCQNTKKEGKILICKQKSKNKIKRVQEICTVCKKILTKSDSLKLACLHRYHKTCGIKMQWKMRYNCELCSTRNDKIPIKIHK